MREIILGALSSLLLEQCLCCTYIHVAYSSDRLQVDSSQLFFRVYRRHVTNGDCVHLCPALDSPSDVLLLLLTGWYLLRLLLHVHIQIYVIEQCMMWFIFLHHPRRLKDSPLVAFGRSLGGAVAICLASRYPDIIKAVIAENTFLSVGGLGDREQASLLFSFFDIVQTPMPHDNPYTSVFSSLLLLCSQSLMWLHRCHGGCSDALPAPNKKYSAANRLEERYFDSRARTADHANIRWAPSKHSCN